MTALLQELIDAPEVEPVARVTGYYAGYLSIATVDGRVLPAGTALYLAPPAPIVPDGWRIVPYTPTVQMLERAAYAVNNRPQPSKYEPSATPAIIFWTAMLNYAPESVPDMPLSMERFGGLVGLARDDASEKAIVYKATNIYGETCYFGVKSTAQAWAKSGSVDEVRLRDLRLVATQTPPEPHPDDIAVDRFAAAMKAKMAQSRDCGRYGWNDPAVCSADDLRLFLANHIKKGDPIDVGNFVMMLFNRNETTAPPQPEPPADLVRDARLQAESEFAALLPGTHYMDLPDGGCVTVREQVALMAMDAERYRWLTQDHPASETRKLVDEIGYCLSVRGYGATSAAIDAAIERDKKGMEA